MASSSTKTNFDQIGCVVDCSEMIAANALQQKKKEFNHYVNNSMMSENELPIWNSGETGFNTRTLPIIIKAHNSEDVNAARNQAAKVCISEFNCNQCGINSKKLVSCFSKSGPILCSYNHTSSIRTSPSNLLYNISNNIYKKIIGDPSKFTLRISTDALLTKDKFKYVDARYKGPSFCIGGTLMHYSGNCKSISGGIKDAPRNIILKDSACKKYWILMHHLLVKLSSSWTLAGGRHATKQRLRTIQELCKEVTYADDHFGLTLTWILNILDMFNKPFDHLPMNDRIDIAAKAICSGNINYDGNGKMGVVHFQYAQMNKTIIMWMKKAINRKALYAMITSLCDPAKKGQRDPTAVISVQQINRGAKMLGEDFTTTIATTGSLAEYYKDYTGGNHFWEAPAPNSGTKNAFADLRAGAGNNTSRKKPIVCSWEGQRTETPIEDIVSIPDLIEQLVSGRKIYIPETYENGIISHTDINPEYIAFKPVPDKGALMWSFLGNRKGFAVNRLHIQNWNRLIAIHYISVGPHTNYILVTDKSNKLPQFIVNNPVMGDWNLTSTVKRHLAPVLVKLRKTTHIIKPSSSVDKVGYPMIGIGLCKSPAGGLVIGDLSFRIDGSSIGKIKYFDKPKVSTKVVIKYCTNCSVPRTKMANLFCGNCGSKF